MQIIIENTHIHVIVISFLKGIMSTRHIFVSFLHKQFRNNYNNLSYTLCKKEEHADTHTHAVIKRIQ